MIGPGRVSVAMIGDLDAKLHEHLLRADGQEDICLATYALSTGATRSSALLRDIVLPEPGERAVHGNASFTGGYVLRAISIAAPEGLGVAILHSHPRGAGWQAMSRLDAEAEKSYAYLAHAMTGLPLFGLTLAGDHTWSARRWDQERQVTHGESVRVISDRLKVHWNSQLRPPPRPQPSQVQTVSGWGERIQADIARLRVLVVGGGSVGLDVALKLAATGIQHVAVMDFDTMEIINLDRITDAGPLDVALHRGKAEHAFRRLRVAATAAQPDLHAYDDSICEERGHDLALDCDVIFSCVDRPWPRAVLNQMAYSDLIPVIDGGIGIDPFEEGDGMRNATWRTHVLRPGRPCLVCNGQLNPADVPLDREGLLDDPEYIRRSDRSQPARQNVAALSISVAASQLTQFISLTAAPGGLGEPGPLQYLLSTHDMQHLSGTSTTGCHFEQLAGRGDARAVLTGRHRRAEKERAARDEQQRELLVRLGRALDDLLWTAHNRLDTFARRHLRPGRRTGTSDRPAHRAPLSEVAPMLAETPLTGVRDDSVVQD